MAIKRLTTIVELDDTTDTDRGTSSPSTLMQKEETHPRRKPGTDIPPNQPDYQEAELERTTETAKKELIGRTTADLVYAFINRPEFMAIIFVIIAFAISIDKLQKPDDLWVPLTIFLTLNAVWFGIISIRKYRESRKKTGK